MPIAPQVSHKNAFRIPIIAAFTAMISILALPNLAQAQQGDPEIELITSMLRGTWKTIQPVDQLNSDGTTEIAMHITPVTLQDIPNAMYVEQSRVDSMDKPYRQVIFQLYRFGPEGTIRLRTLEFKNDPGIRPTLVGLWAAPEVFPLLNRAGMYATVDLNLTAHGDSFVGSTPAPYPTAFGNAVEMTSSLEIRPNRLVTLDQGIAQDGSIAWGANAENKLTWQHWDSGIIADFLDDGLVLIDLVTGDGRVAQDGDDVTVHYQGWVREMDTEVFGGSRFDSSLHREQGPEPFTFPLPGRLIEGWNRGMPGARVGTVRRLFIPAALAYGNRPRPGIPANSDLFFEVKLLDIVSPDVPVDQQD